MCAVRKQLPSFLEGTDKKFLKKKQIMGLDCFLFYQNYVLIEHESVEAIKTCFSIRPQQLINYGEFLTVFM